MLKRNIEVTGHDLLGQYADAAAEFQARLNEIATEATDRETVVDSRLKDLEAEKAVLKQLSQKQPDPMTWSQA